MSKKINRRDFVLTGAAAAVLTKTGFGQAPSVQRGAVKPVVVASSNGHEYKNGGAQTCVEKAFAMIAGGADVLDAVVAGVALNELDPRDASVGYASAEKNAVSNDDINRAICELNEPDQ